MFNALAIVGVLVLTVAAALAGTPFDARFLRDEALSSAYELRLARLGEAHAVRADVRAYASTLVNDHEVYSAALQELGRSKGVSLPLRLDRGDEWRLDLLANIHGAGFDSAFLREALRVNAQGIRAFRMEASRTTDPAIRIFVARFLKVDAKHEDRARELSEHIVVFNNGRNSMQAATRK
jgi:putative membrane protein